MKLTKNYYYYYYFMNPKEYYQKSNNQYKQRDKKASEPRQKDKLATLANKLKTYRLGQQHKNKEKKIKFCNFKSTTTQNLHFPT